MMPNPINVRRKRIIFFFSFLILLYILSVLINLNLPLLNNEEPRRATISIEMLNSGNYIMPTLFGYDYFNKPPVFNWILAGFIFFTGSDSEYIIRLPSLIFLLLLAASHYLIAKRFLPKNIAALSSIFTLTCADVYFYALQNGGEIDIFYALVVYLQVMAIFYYGHKKQWLPLFLLSYLFCAIGFLTKGYPSFLFQGLTLFALCFFHRSIRPLFQVQHLAGILILVGVVGSYLYFFSFYNPPERLLINLLNESFKKSAVGEKSEQLLSKVFTYPGLVFKFLLPWSLLLILLIKRVRLHLWSNPLVCFSILFILFNVGVYWFTGKPKMRYVYMFLPFYFTVIAYIYWRYKSRFNPVISMVLKYLGFIFLVVLTGVIILPFIFETSTLWTIILALALGFFSYLYFKQSRYSIWMFILGLVLVRTAYAALALPIQHERRSMRYDLMLSEISWINKNQPLTYWSPPDSMKLMIDMKFKKWNYGSFAAPPEFHYQIPYYYHRYTGDIMKYESTIKPNKAYITYKGWLKDSSVQILWSSHDRKVGDELIVFKK
jgi:4-amino-4-deoxy-L-arabinose transferase-like glycosyltransferase